MRNIGLFSGSFNPIHRGHTSLAEAILNQSDLDEIWLVVSPHNPLKQQSGLIDEQHRLRMVDLALKYYNNMHSSDVEFHLPKPSYTVNTLRYLSEQYPDCKFTLIIGTDNLRVFDRWRESDYILSHYDIIVYPREGDDIQQLVLSYPQVKIVNAPLFPISSTKIRAMLAAQPYPEETAQWLSKDVLNYISDNKLY